MESLSPGSHFLPSQDSILSFPCLQSTEAVMGIMGMIQTIPAPAQSLFGSHALSNTGSSTREKHLGVPHFHPHATYTYSHWCGSATQLWGLLLLLLHSNCHAFNKDKGFEVMPRILPAWESFTEDFQPLCPPTLVLRRNINCLCSVLHMRIWAPEQSCLCAWTAKLLPKEQRKWIWGRYSAGQQYLWREGFNLDINQYIIAYVACPSSLLMI